MEKNASFKSFIIALLIGLGGALAGAYSPTLLIPAAAGAVYLGVRHGKVYAACAALFTLLSIFFAHLGNDITMYTFWGAYSFFVIFATAAFLYRLPYRIIALVLAAAALIALYLGFGLPSLLAGKAPYDGILESLRSLDEAYRSMGYLVEDIAELRESIPTTFYGMLIIMAEAVSFLTVVLAHWFLKLSKADIRPMARFREWQLPQSLKLGLPVFAAAIIILYAIEFPGAPTLLFALLYLLLPMLAAAGIGTALYLASRGRESVSLPVKLFVVLAAIMSPYFMALLGAVDLYAGIRRRLIRTDKLIREAFEKANREKSNTVTVDFGDGNGPQIIAVRKNKNAFFDNALEDDDEKSGENEASEPSANSEGSTQEGEDPTEKNENNDKPDNNDGGEN